MKPLFLCYSKCGTCNKALRWLQSEGVEVDRRDITIENPTQAELTLYLQKSGLPISKFFNTSGVKYRELKVKEIIKTASTEELLALLATDGKLVKRPVLVTDSQVLVGFDPEQYSTLLK